MPTIKIYPPTQLPDRGVTETQFSIWCEEMEVYLAQEAGFAQFLPDGNYSTWLSKESNPDRILQLHDEDLADPELNTPAAREAKLRSVRTKLRTVLSIIGKCVSEGHYNPIIRHATSLQWIYDTLRADYDIKQRGIHFFNILDVKYDPSVDTPVSFYNKYRTIIVNNLAKVGDVVKYKNEELTEDEKMSPMLEDVILLNVLREINPNLPKIVRSHYNHKMQPDDKMMDFKSDMLNNIPSFLQQADIEENNAFGSANLGAFRQQPQKKNTRRPFSRQFSKFYCRMCFLEKLPKEIFTSHNFGDKMCKSISKQDKLNFESNKLSNIKDTSESGENEDELAEMFGYCNSNLQDDSEQEVDCLTNNKNLDINCRHPKADMNFIRPVASQILTVFENPDDTVPLHIDLDSGATLNYCEEDQVKSRGFKMYPNTQMSKLGDGVT